jgi:hypothetical protein
MPLTVLPGYFYSLWGDVGGYRSQQWPVGCHGHDDSAAAGAYVGQAAGLVNGQHLQAGVNNAFGLRAGHQHVRRNEQAQPVELLVPRQVCHGFATRPALDQDIE